jgi:hypothetical protein
MKRIFPRWFRFFVKFGQWCFDALEARAIWRAR